jgi:hypothetical protein
MKSTPDIIATTSSSLPGNGFVRAEIGPPSTAPDAPSARPRRHRRSPMESAKLGSFAPTHAAWIDANPLL